MLAYKESCSITPEEIVKLRKSVGWNGMLECYRTSLKKSYFYLCCFDNEKLVGFLDVVSNGVTDAYIQDVIVDPNYQNQGIGTHLMKLAIKRLCEDNIYSISVLFEEKLLGFYKKFGFNIMMAGQMETHMED